MFILKALTKLCTREEKNGFQYYFPLQRLFFSIHPRYLHPSCGCFDSAIENLTVTVLIFLGEGLRAAQGQDQTEKERERNLNSAEVIRSGTVVVISTGGKKTQHFFFSNSELRISKTFAKSRKRRIFLFVESNFLPSKKGAFEDKFLGFLTYLNYFSGNYHFNLVYAIQQQNTTELNKWSETNISSTGEKNQKANETDEET